MQIIELHNDDKKEEWNRFVAENVFVGAFLESWEWGVFQSSLGQKVRRFIVSDKNMWTAVFLLVEHKVAGSITYGYMPRGPVLSKKLVENPRALFALFSTIEKHVRLLSPRMAFVKMEPPVTSISKDALPRSVKITSDYLQPKHNSVVNMSTGLENTQQQFSRQLKRGIRIAKKRGVTAMLKGNLDKESFKRFLDMQANTSTRAGKNVYPRKVYFEKMLEVFSPVEDTEQHSNRVTIGFVCGYWNDKLVAINLILFFGDVATFLFGGTMTDALVSKVGTYIHWKGITEAHKLGYTHYDLGGVDEKKWPTLTYFKNQWGGEVVSYIGEIDLVVSPVQYRAYKAGIRARRLLS